MNESAILQILRLIDTLSRYGLCSADTLTTMHSVSVATLKRQINEARILGADICSVRRGGQWLYELRNADAVMPRVELWIDLEQKRDLLA
jgi:predicted DNA-binding transcriptional regulator YafY